MTENELKQAAEYNAFDLRNLKTMVDKGYRYFWAKRGGEPMNEFRLMASEAARRSAQRRAGKPKDG